MSETMSDTTTSTTSTTSGATNGDATNGTATPGTGEHPLDALSRHARALAASLPGGLSRLTVTAGDHRVEAEWHAGDAAPGAYAAPAAAPAAASAAASAAGTVAAAEPEPAERFAGHVVAAPLVGTFYRSPEPGAPPFVSEGDVVEVGQELAIVEAMKIMNRIEADHAGRVVKILPSDGELVEFGQELMLIEPVDPE